MNASRGLSRLRWIPLAVALLAFALGGCEDDTTPVITKLEANPSCDVMTEHTMPQAGTWLDVMFFARASSGNRFDDPTGGNSPLEWRWDFGDGGSASNVVGPVHRYTEAGTYEVTLTVEDKDGQTASKTITVFVGEQYTDLDVVLVESELAGTAPNLRLGPNPSGIPNGPAGGAARLDGWSATYQGHLASNCEISGLYQQYAWAWDFGDGSTIEHLDRPTHRYAPAPGSYTSTLEVTELATGVSRSTTVSASHPAGLSVSSSGYKVIGDVITVRVNGHLLQGMTELQASIAYDDSLLGLTNAVALDDLVNGGFAANIDTATPGRIDFSFSRASALGSAEATIGLVELTFMVDVTASAYNVPLDPHQVIPTSVGVESFSVIDQGTESRDVGSIDGVLWINSDCDGNGTADNVQLALDPFAVDVDPQDGILDACQ